ncbi:hypothetical protein HYY74_05585 [Candidatus Woesearchaeota archaeon]|nr:hypothetical protein [Candidatus Woesearchaeota archaeon]
MTDALAKVGSWAFILGVIIAVIAGLVDLGSNSATVTGLLIALGMIVGFLNVTGKETTAFLLASVSLVLVSKMGGEIMGDVPTIGPYINGVFGAILTFVVPATIIVALKAIYALAADE